MKLVWIFAALLTVTGHADAQKYFTRDGKITFSSDAPMEKIQAVNSKVSSVVNIETGEMEFAVLIKSFHFEKALMEEHFNENYMESTKYPKATFKGKITNIGQMKLSTPGTYQATVQGDLTIHGVTKPVTTQAQLVVTAGNIRGTSKFDIVVADYQIEIPKVVRDNIAKVVQISVDMQYKPMEQ